MVPLFLSSDFFLLNKLKKGLTLSGDLLFRIEEESLFVEAYVKSLSLLNGQAYTAFNLKMKLLSKDLDKNGIERALELLKKKGYVDDERFARTWVSQRLNTRLDSYNSLLSGLLKKGINSGIAKCVINEFYDDETENNIIKKNVDKCCRAGKSSDKIIKALIRKGFNRNKVFYFVNNMESFNEGY